MNPINRDMQQTATTSRCAQPQPRLAITAVKLPTGARALALCREPHARPWITSLVKFFNHREH